MSAAADNDSWVLVDNENSPTADQPQELTIQNDQEEQMADNPQQIIDESDSNNQPQLVSNPDGSTQNECITAWEPIRLRQEWNIQNFARVMELSSPGVCMRSYKFMDDSMQDIDWQLCLYPGGKREENIGNVSLFLRMSTFVYAQKDFTVRAEYRFYFVDDTGIAKFSNVNTGDFKVKPSSKGSHSWGLRNIPRHKVLQSIRQDGSLHIVCEVEILPDFNKLQSHLRQDYRLGLETEPPFIEIRQNRSLTLTEFITIIEERGEVVNLLVYCPNGAGRRRRCVMPVLPWDIDRFSGCGGKLVEDIAYELRQYGKRQSHGIYEFQVFYVNRDAAVDWVQYFF